MRVNVYLTFHTTLGKWSAKLADPLMANVESNRFDVKTQVMPGFAAPLLFENAGDALAHIRGKGLVVNNYYNSLAP